jgi:hypothetical protein
MKNVKLFFLFVFSLELSILLPNNGGVPIIINIIVNLKIG